jgi:PAS domain S-box-containing protein
LHDIAVTDIGWEACSMYDKKGHRRPPGAFPIHGLYGRVLIGGKSFFTNDPAAHPDSVGTPEGHPLLKAFLGVPLISGGKTVGMIAAANRDGGYREEDRQALESMAPAILESLRHFRTGQAMRESEERLKRSQEIAQLGSWELDLVRNVLTWSDEVYRIFGLQPQEFEATYEAFLSAVHPDDRAAVDAAYSRSLREGKNSYEIEHRVVRRSTGEVRQVHEKCDHFRDASGRVIRSTGMVHDITERKRMEEELRRTSERYRSYIDVTGQLGWTTNADGEVVEDMPSWRAYTGQTAAEIMGWGWSKALHPDDARHTARVWSTAVAEHSAYEVEYRLRRHDGTYRHFLARGIPVISDSGAVREWVGTCIDITQRKQAEEALQQAHDELEQRVAQRTRFYNVRAQINEAATRSRDVQEYLDEVCRVMTETGGFKLAWVGIVDPQSRMVRPAASCGATGYLEGLTIMAADVPDGKGPTGRAITEGRHVINMDFETNEMMRPWRVRAREYGLRSSSAFPLRVHDETVGALMIYSSQPSFFTGEELSLLLNIADDISFALEAYDTGQKRLGAERELRKTAVELQDLYNNAPCGYHSLDKEGVIVRINDTELSWLGYSREEVVGKKKITDFFTPEGVRRFQERFQDFVRTGAVADLEFDLIRRDGSIMQGVLSSTAMYDGDGRYVMSRSMLYDITDRKKAEQQSLVTNALLSLYARKFDRKAYLSAAVELIRSWSRCRYIGIRVADDHGYIPYLSCVGFSDEFLASERTLSLDRDHCACTRVVLGTPEPQDLPAMTAAGSFYSNNTLRFVEGLTEEQKSRFRGVCVQSGFLSVAVVPIRYSDRVLGALHVADGREGMVPLAGVEFLEQAAFIIGEAVHRFGVEEERMRLASALESTADGVVITRPGNGTIEYVNRAFEQITGYSKDEAVGNTLHLLDSGRHNKAFFDELRSVLHRDGVWRGRLLNRKKDGTLYFEDCTFSPVRDQAGDILNYVSIKRDVTEKIRMESIAESVSMLDNIGAVFAGVRHEIGNPVNNVKMMLSVLKQKLDDLAPERVRHYTDRMLDEIKRVEHLLRTLKTFNLFETPEVEALDTTPLLDLFQGLVREDLEARGIALSVQILPGAERVRADGRAVQHVLLNLTTNAADALKGRDRPRIAITLSREDDEVHIRVSDNGAGMTEEQQKNLFKPFQTTKPKGTGLGLVIVKKMLTSINGRIAIDSKVGSGTIAHVYVPAEGPC